MKRNYQGVLERIKTVAQAHPQINSADDGRELEFDVNKTQQWPRAFIRTEAGALLGGQGTVELVNDFTLLIMDRLETDRSNVVDVLNSTHSILTDVLATLNKEQLIRVEDGIAITPMYDYQDSQSAGWSAGIRIYTDSSFECYPVGEFNAAYEVIYDGWLTKPSDFVANNQNRFVQNAIDHKYWSDLDAAFIFANEINSGGESLDNWRVPGTFATMINNPLFTSLEGFTGDAATQYLDLNIDLSTLTNYQLNDAMIAFYSRSNLSGAWVDLGIRDATGWTASLTRNGGIIIALINSWTLTGAPMPGTLGMITIARGTPALQNIFYNDILIQQVSAASTNIPVGNCYALAENISGPIFFSPRQMSGLFIGKNLNACKRAWLQSDFEAYMDSNGKGVIP